MAFRRKMLEAMGIESEKIDEIMAAHGEVVDALKEQRDSYKEAAEKLPGVQEELNALKEHGTGESGYKKKFDDEHAAFEAFKAQIEAEKTNAQKNTLYRELLTQCKIDPKRFDAIMRVTDLDSLTIKDGKLEGVDKLTEAISKDWADFATEEREQGEHVENPPGGGNGGEKDLGNMSMADYIAARKKM